LERVTSPAFGTVVGRWFTLFVLVPFGSSLLILDGLQLLLDHTLRRFWPALPLFGPLHWLMPTSDAARTKALADVLAGLSGMMPDGLSAISSSLSVAASMPDGGSTLPASFALVAVQRPSVPLLNMLEFFLCLGVILMGLLHSERLRRWAAMGFQLGWSVTRGLLYDLPIWILSRPWVRQMWDSWPFHVFAAFFLGPLAVCLLLRWWAPTAFDTWVGSAGIFLAVSFVLNSRFGREIGEGFLQALHDFYEQLRAGLLPGLFRLIMAVFRRILDTIEYVLFTVDEWLRFRTGEGSLSMAVRAVATVLWYPISFLIRFYLVVLIEPGFNPVKAPVSILAAKFIYPIVGGFTRQWIVAWHHAVGPALTWGLLVPTVWLLPDVFGFFFWEIKENWRLYKANRRPALGPVPVGPRGETVRQLLEPGFHSGTVPKLYARLRQAERDALQTGNWRAARGYWRSLAEVQQSLQRLVEREFVTLLREGQDWHNQPLAVGRMTLAPRQIRIELTHGGYPAEPALLEWSLHGERLMAALLQPGWVSRVSEEQRQAAAAGLAGLYKLAGVDLVSEQVRANVPPAAAAFDVIGTDLVLWVVSGQEPAALYDLDTPKGPLQPRNPQGTTAAGWPPLDPARILYAQVPLTWQRWVARWQGDADGKAPAPLFSPAVQLLPAGNAV
jgi:hypothetical protein